MPARRVFKALQIGFLGLVLLAVGWFIWVAGFQPRSWTWSSERQLNDDLVTCMSAMESTVRVLGDSESSSDSIAARVAQLNQRPPLFDGTSEWLICPVHHLPYIVNLRGTDWARESGAIVCVCPWHTPERGLVVAGPPNTEESVARELSQKELPDWVIQRMLLGE